MQTRAETEYSLGQRQNVHWDRDGTLGQRQNIHQDRDRMYIRYRDRVNSGKETELTCNKTQKECSLGAGRQNAHWDGNRTRSVKNTDNE